MIIGVSGYIGQRKTGIGRTLENVLLLSAKARPSDIFYLFTNYDQVDLTGVEWPDNVKIILINVSCKSPVLNILWHQIGFQYNLRKFKCDIALIPNFSLLLWKVCPTIVVVHDLIEFHVKNKFSRLRMLYRYLSVPLLAHRGDFIITDSESSKNDIIEILRVKASKVRVAYCGYDPLRFAPQPLEVTTRVLAKYSLQPFSYVLSIGTVDFPGKNVYSLIKAYFLLREKGSIDCKLLVVGKPGHRYEKILELVKSSRHQNDVVFLGYIDDTDLPSFYNGALLFGFLSFYEGFGLPVLEAMACGCPVIASKASSLPEIVGNAGSLVDPSNIEEISAAMENILLSSSLQEQYKKEGMEQVRKFSWEAAAEVYGEAFSRFSSRIGLEHS